MYLPAWHCEISSITRTAFLSLFSGCRQKLPYRCLYSYTNRCILSISRNCNILRLCALWMFWHSRPIWNHPTVVYLNIAISLEYSCQIPAIFSWSPLQLILRLSIVSCYRVRYKCSRIYPREFPVVNSDLLIAWSMYHVLVTTARKSLSTSAHENSISSEVILSWSQISMCACGNPLFYHSTENFQQRMDPHTSYLIMKSISDLSFCLKTRAVMSCLSMGDCPGSNSYCISSQFGF
jgi:hypothetical protein